MNFDTPYDRRGLGITKWDDMEKYFGVSPDDGIPMWVADMDFHPAPCVEKAAKDLARMNDYGYFTNQGDYADAVSWWAENRHGWKVDPDWCSITNGLGNAIGMCLHTYTDPGDEVVIFSPVYLEFLSKIERNNRVPRQLPLVEVDGQYQMDFEAYEAQMSGREKMMILCSPHNPAGRVWTLEELKQIAAFCEKHDLILVSDEIHQDLVFPGFKHLTFLAACPEATHRTVVLSSASKTFNIAGLRTGTVIIPDPKLRSKFKALHYGLDMSPHLFGLRVTVAALSSEGADWVDGLQAYLADNARLFVDAMNQIPGLKAHEMQSTYLSWVDFSGTGMAAEDYRKRVMGDARIAPSPGEPFGVGGETGLRFNIATQRARLAEAIARIQTAFSDLQ